MACQAQAPVPGDHFQGQAPGEAQAIMHRYEGPISSVDLKEKSLTLKTGEAQLTFKVTAKTKITRGTAAGSFDDLAVGKAVELTVKHINAQGDEVTSIDIKSP